MIRKVSTILFILCVTTQLFCQSKSLDENAWKNTTNGVDYFEQGKQDSPVESNTEQEPMDFDDMNTGDKNESSRRESSNSSKSNSSGSPMSIPGWLSTFLMILVIGLLLFVIVSAIIKNPKGMQKRSSVRTSFSNEELESIEQNPFENDLEKYIHDAKESGNYRLAIRFCFIYIIRLLAENGSIVWKKHKTNHQYYQELSGNDFQGAFQYMKLIYESIWYGNISLNEQMLRNSLTLFENNVSSLKQSKKAS